MKKAVPNVLDVVKHHARELARDAFVAAAADVHRCPLTPDPSPELTRALGRVMTAEELRHYGHQYREELHVLGCTAEVQALRAQRPRPLFTEEEGRHIVGLASGRIACVHPEHAVSSAKRVPGFVCGLCGALFKREPKAHA